MAILIRFLHFGALTLLVGAFAFLLLVARPAFRRAGDELRSLVERFDQRLLRLASWSLLVAGGVLTKTLASEGQPPVPLHMEFLVDRQGYIRARWIPGGEPGWADLPRLLREMERLAREAPRAPAPEEHVH